MDNNPTLMNQKKIPIQETLTHIFRDSFLCSPFVFKQIFSTFCVFWFPVVFIIFFMLGMLDGNSLMGQYLSTQGSFLIPALEACFTIVLVPYFVFKFVDKQKVMPFWDFVADSAFPLVINHIKALLIIILHLCLLIVPGVIKGIRLIFVTQATFFGKEYKGVSALKFSEQLVKNFFWGIVLLILSIIALRLFALAPFLTIEKAFHIKAVGGMPYATFQLVKYFFEFFIRCFSLILITQAFFILKKKKGL